MIDYDFSVSEPMKYWSLPSSYSQEMRKERINDLIDSKNYIWSLKTDGNWSRAVLSPDFCGLQSRGISKKTGTYSELQEKVVWWDSVQAAFEDTTVLIGEIYLDDGVDADVGSILRCLKKKALDRQKERQLKWRIFDVLAYEGKNLLDSPIIERIGYIQKAVDKINNPLVSGVTYYEMDENFFRSLFEIFDNGGEGVVCYKKTAPYSPGKRTAWDTLKIKQEVSEHIDAFIFDKVPPTKDYTGKELATWQYWYNEKTSEMLYGNYFDMYANGQKALSPVTKNYFYNWPGAISCGVFDENGKIVHLCDCAGLTEELKQELSSNWKEWKMCPISLTGMTVSERTGISLRHPKLVSIRKEDLSIEDCLLSKIIN